MSYENMSLREFSETLASKSAVPGGGGASALAASLAASLGLMVGNLTLGKAKYAANEPELKALMAKSEALRMRLLELIDADAEVFAPLAEAYSIPKDTPGRDRLMEERLAAAAAVPLEIMELSCQVIDLQDGFHRLGSKLALSDAGTGAVFAWGAMYGAALNVLVNTKSMTDKAAAQGINAKVRALMEKYWPVADRVYEEIFSSLL